MNIYDTGHHIGRKTHTISSQQRRNMQSNHAPKRGGKAEALKKRIPKRRNPQMGNGRRHHYTQANF